LPKDKTKESIRRFPARKTEVNENTDKELFTAHPEFGIPLPRSRGSDIFRANGSTNCGDGPSVPMARSYRNDDGKAEGKSKKAKVKRAEGRIIQS